MFWSDRVYVSCSAVAKDLSPFKRHELMSVVENSGVQGVQRFHRITPLGLSDEFNQEATRPGIALLLSQQ